MMKQIEKDSKNPKDYVNSLIRFLHSHGTEDPNNYFSGWLNYKKGEHS